MRYIVSLLLATSFVCVGVYMSPVIFLRSALPDSRCLLLKSPVNRKLCYPVQNPPMEALFAEKYSVVVCIVIAKCSFEVTLYARTGSAT